VWYPAPTSVLDKTLMTAYSAETCCLLYPILYIVCDWFWEIYLYLKTKRDKSSQNKMQIFLILFFVVHLVTIVSCRVKMKYQKNYCIQGCNALYQNSEGFCCRVPQTPQTLRCLYPTAAQRRIPEDSSWTLRVSSRIPPWEQQVYAISTIPEIVFPTARTATDRRSRRVHFVTISM
jgi:hypothetical protein